MQAVYKDSQRGEDQLLEIKDVCEKLLLDLVFYIAASVIHQKMCIVSWQLMLCLGG